MWCQLAVLLLALAQVTDYAAEGLKALDEQNYAVAAQQFSKAVEADPKDYAARFHLALVNSLLGKDAEAIAGYKTVLELKPGLYEARLNLGILLLRQKQPREASVYLEAAVNERPKEFRPNFYLAEALLASGESTKAEQYYRAAQELDPKSVAVRERLGELLIEAGKPAEAVPHLEWAVEKSPTAANRVALATAYIRSNQAEKAALVLGQAVAAEPQDAALRMRYGRVLRDLKMYSAAAAEFNRVAQAKPDSVEAWNELAGMLTLLENYPQALAALDRVKALGAEGPGHYYLRAIILDKTGQKRAALENYQKFLATSQGKSPNDEFKARQRVRILQKELDRR